MRVGNEAVGGTPFDAAGPKGVDAVPGDASSAAAGFFALLTLLQGGGLPGEIDAADADGEPDALDEASAADAIDAGTAGSSAAGDVVVTLSGNAVAAAAAAATPAAPQGPPAGTGPPAPSGPPSGSAAVLTDAPSGGTATVEADLPTARAAAATSDATTKDAATAALPATTGDVARAATQAAPDAAAATLAHQAADTSSAERAPGASPRLIEGDAPASVVVAGAAPAETPTGAAPATQADPDPDRVRATSRSDAASTTIDAHTGGGAAAGGDATPEESTEHHDRSREPSFAPRRPGPSTSAERIAPPASLDPATASPSSEATGRSADIVPVGRDAAVADGTSRAVGAQRAALTDGGSLPDWIERLTRPQQLAAARRTNALRFDLEPAGLGRIEVRLSFGRDGVRAQVFAEHEHTRGLIAHQQTQLAAAFERNDLRLESFLVDLGLGGEGSGDARRETGDPTAFELGLAGGAPLESEHDVPATTPIVTGLLSVRA